jgi:Fe-S-cluster containining protein
MMTPSNRFDADALKTLFYECRQCGACCKKYSRIALYPDEVEFIRKMGGYVGVNASIAQLRDKSLEVLIEEAKMAGTVYMIHPDEKGCVFLQKRNGKHYCKIYHYRPRTCRGFRCNMADNTFLDVFGQDATALLGMDAFGLPMKPS